MKTRKYLILIILCMLAITAYGRKKEKQYPINSVAIGRLLQHVEDDKILVRASDQEFYPSSKYFDTRLQKYVDSYSTKTIKGYINGDIVIELPIDHEALQLPDDEIGVKSIELYGLQQDGVIEITYNKVSKSGTDVVRGTFRKFVLADTPKPELTKLEKIEQQVNALKLSLDEIQKQPADKINIQKVLSVITEQLLSISKQLDEIKKESNFSSNR